MGNPDYSIDFPDGICYNTVRGVDPTRIVFSFFAGLKKRTHLCADAEVLNRYMKQQKSRKLRRLAGLLAVLACTCSLSVPLAGCGKTVTQTIRVGELLPDSVRLLGASASDHIEGIVDDRATHAGTYEIPVQTDSGQSYTLRLRVIDRVAPVVTPRHVFCALGTSAPQAADFIGSIQEYDSYTASFVEPLPDLSALGDYDVSFRVEDASGNTTKTLKSVVTVIRDTEPPVFAEVPEPNAYVGEAIAYRDGLVVTDNCCGEVHIDVDASAVNPNAEGSYPVVYTATDASGNRSTARSTVHVTASRISQDSLNQRIDGIIAEYVTTTATVESQLRDVYAYIQANIFYAPSQDTGDRVSIAFNALNNRSGDCYAYNCVAMAFLDRLGVEYMEIQRSPGLTNDTHYWLLVNIGSKTSPRWYHYDCTRLRAEYNHSGCLLTDKQIRAYSKVRANFYTYDTSRYPASSTEIITRTPELEPYYS